MGEENKRLAINVAAQIIAFSAQLLISFFLTPFVVDRLGVDAYGFIGLAENIIMYAQLLVIALNSMSLRFISIAYYRKDMYEVNCYASSVFYSNLLIAILVLIFSIPFIFYLERILVIPSNLIYDVKLLFFLMFLNFEITIAFSVYQAATFIKNRIELNSIRSITANIIRIVVLVVLFLLFKPYLYYLGLAAVICSLYIAYTNKRYTQLLTPEIILSFRNVNLIKIKTLISSGSWNTITKLSNILGENLDLLLSNLFISAFAMGNLSLAKKLPVLTLSLISSICVAFGPMLTKCYALNDLEEMKKKIFFSIKIVGAISIIPLCFLFSISDVFYSLWVPSLDYRELYIITIICTLPLILAITLEPIQHIIVITNKVKGYSIATVIFNFLTFVSLLIVVNIISPDYRLYSMIGSVSFWALFRVGLFLPIYSAYCLNEKKGLFYGIMFRIIFTLLISTLFSILIKCLFVVETTWMNLILISFFIMIVCALFSWFIVLDDYSKNRLLVSIRDKICKIEKDA